MTDAPPTSYDAGVDDHLSEQMAHYRNVREQIERNTLSMATSVDGWFFEVQASLHHLTLKRGSYVALDTESGTRLGHLPDGCWTATTFDRSTIGGNYTRHLQP